MAELSAEFLTTADLAELLHLKERKIYELAASGKVPCSRATGKLLFPRQAIDAWIASHSSGFDATRTQARPNVVAGSHDPLLEWALRESRAGLATYFDGSLDGLDRLAAGGAVASAMHVYDGASGEWNLPVVASRFAHQPVVLMEFGWRERGLVVRSGSERSIKGIGDLRGQRVVPRQPEAGSQALLLHLMGEHGVSLTDVEFTALARTETDAALAVADGQADVALGLLGLARQLQLGFVSLINERFDLVIDRRCWFEPPLQRFQAFCRSREFLIKAQSMGGYDVSGFGHIHFNGP